MLIIIIRLWGRYIYNYPLVICYIAIENGPFIVDLPIKDSDFPRQTVSLPEGNGNIIGWLE